MLRYQPRLLQTKCADHCVECNAQFKCITCQTGYSVSGNGCELSTYTKGLIYGFAAIGGILVLYVIFKIVRVIAKKYGKPENTENQAVAQQSSAQVIQSGIDTGGQLTGARNRDVEKFLSETPKKVSMSVECSVCAKKNVNCRLSCSHNFHEDCLFQWQRETKRTDCLVCQKPVAFLHVACTDCNRLFKVVETCGPKCKAQEHSQCIISRIDSRICNQCVIVAEQTNRNKLQKARTTQPTQNNVEQGNSQASEPT